MTALDSPDDEEKHLDDAFALLGNETRMSILRELWTAREPFAPTADNTLAFSELRERVGASDPGRFNYHLGKLVGEFIERTEGGYVLRPNAVLVLRAAEIRADIGDAVLEPTSAEDPCPFCGGDVEVRYEGEQLVVRCTACPGEYETETAPEGTLVNSQVFPPTGLEGRTGQEIWEAVVDHMAAAAFSFVRGVCYECGAQPVTSVSVCEDHAPSGICEGCGSTQVALGTISCEVCGAAWRGPAWVPAKLHPDVIGFFHEHGVRADGGLTLEVYREFLVSPESVLSTEPFRLEKRVELDGDELTVVIDEELNVTEVRG